jgi:hypothetical protein
MTGAGGPIIPEVPVDVDDNVYYIPLAYVRVWPGFLDGANVLSQSDVWECCPAVGSHCRPANQSNKLTSVNVERWAINGIRPSTYLPPTMIGKEELVIAIDLESPPFSHTSGAIIDDTRDWSDRLFKWTAYAQSSGVPRFVWEQGDSPDIVPSARTQPGKVASGMGNSMTYARDAVFYADSSVLSEVATWVSIGLDNWGNLVVNYDGNPAVKLLIMLEATARLS